ncbi:MAG TPA: DNA-directed RNA polymerase [Gammaproteobacteria bacterium]|nr:DNA-directed RNA polymerase [Gammaproteobacteria bacterium]
MNDDDERAAKLHALQLTIEDTMVSKGAERYRHEVESRGLSNSGPGKALRERVLHRVAKAIEEYVKPRRGGRDTRRKLLRDIDPYILADLTMRRVLDAAAQRKRKSLTSVAKAVGTAVEWHTRDQQLYAAHQALWRRKQEQLKKTDNPSFRRASIDGSVRSMRAWAEEQGRTELATRLAEVKGVEWTNSEVIDAGTALIDCFARASKLVTTEEVRKGKRDSTVIVRFSDGAEKWLERQHGYRELLRPLRLPMVVEPRPWTALRDGGYLDNSKANVPFIKTKAATIDMDAADMENAYKAVSLIQSTPLRVNRSVLEVMLEVWDAGHLRIGRVPPRYHEDGAAPLPELTEEQKRMTPAERKADPECRAVLQRRREAHEFNADLKSDIDTFSRLMLVAKDYVQHERFWLPYKLDWRQRCYSVVTTLSPQGDQFSRALVEFAEGRRMGDSDSAGAWLAIHGANVYGENKVDFQGRIDWVAQHEEEILASAADPMANTFWQDADGGAKAWPFLAFCFEWAGYRRFGDDWCTHLPVALDGSNSGLQHLSAMMRDADGAAATNVSPSEAPADIYTEICDMVTAQLKRSADPWARVWLDAGIDRTICKQPTMTYAYSATRSGMAKQIESALAELDRKAKDAGKPKQNYLPFTAPDQTNFEAAKFLAPIVEECIKERLPRAAAAMRFLIDCAKVANEVDMPLRWTTPVGVPVAQFYPAWAQERKKVFIDGRRHDLVIKRPVTGKVDKRGTKSGISPNFVHSLDSSHLLWTVLECHDEFDITDFAMVHDSFGTHATECDVMETVLRDAFVRLYEEDRLEEFRAALLERIPEELHAKVPPVPEKGTFDLEAVCESPYFFA